MDQFDALSEYAYGDDVRRIDWAASARRGRLQARIGAEDRSLSLAAVIDSSASMAVGRVRSLRGCAQEIARCWFGAAQSQDRCISVPFSQTPPRLLRSLRRAAGIVPAGAALLVVSDFFCDDDALAQAIAMLGRRCRCAALIARDPWRNGLPLHGFVHVRDAENAGRRLLFLGCRQRAAYRKAVLRREQRLLCLLRRARWRAGFVEEHDGSAALLRLFNL